MRVSCTCGKLLEVPVDPSGECVRCPGCGQPVAAPTPEEAAAREALKEVAWGEDAPETPQPSLRTRRRKRRWTAPKPGLLAAAAVMSVVVLALVIFLLVRSSRRSSPEPGKPLAGVDKAVAVSPRPAQPQPEAPPRPPVSPEPAPATTGEPPAPQPTDDSRARLEERAAALTRDEHLVLHDDFEEGTGSTVRDRSGKGHDVGVCPLKPDPPPQMDNSLNEWYANPAPITIGGDQMAYGKAKWKGNGDLSGTLWLYWDRNCLYVAAEVVDDRFVQTQTGDKIWNGDHLELYIDTVWKPGVAGPFGKGQFHFGFSPGNLQYTGDALFDLPPEVVVALPVDLNTNPVKIAAFKTEEGYAVETVIPWKLLGVKPVKGMTLGVDLCISDTDNNDSQDTMSSLVPGPWAGQKREHLVPMRLGDSQGK